MYRGRDFPKKPQNADDGSKEWELRPGGMLVQKRDPNADAAHAGPLINLRVSYGRMYHHVSITANSTFGDLKKLLVQDTGLQPQQQRLQYKGKERNDIDILREIGLKDKSKVVLVEDIASSEKRLIELRKAEAATKACKAVSEVQQLVDKLSGQIATVELAVTQGKQLNESEFTGLIDLLMCQLLKLDASKVDGDANVKKRILVRRIQKYVETLDVLLLRNNTLKAQGLNNSSISQGLNNSLTAQAVNNSSNTQGSNNSLKTQSSLRQRSNGARVHFDANVQKNDIPNNAMSKAGVSTTWESFGANYSSTKVSAPVSEPLLIQWD